MSRTRDPAPVAGHDCGSCALQAVAPVGVVGEQLTVALVGNPSSGKSTLFNALTGMRQRVGNWPGTTVTRAEGSYRHDGSTVRVVDLPGITSVGSDVAEETVARDYLLSGRPDVCVVVVDATRLERHLYLVLQLVQLGGPLVVALNLVDEAERAGIAIDERSLSRELGVRVVPVVARERRGLARLSAAIVEAAAQGVSVRPVSRAVDAELQDRVVEARFAEADRITRVATSGGGRSRSRVLEQRLDRLLTHRVWGFAAMAGLLVAVFWITIAGAAWPSDLLFRLLVGEGHPVVHDLLVDLGLPSWTVGVLADGAYLGTAWVVAVMLPPMAIFFPLFALLEDAGYLPRVAFDLDRAFQGAGAHGKQALSMMMGFGCNAAGVTATRIIDSPRERLIAIITNNFSICNGRWPTLILMGTVFVGATVSPVWAGLVAALAVVAVAVLGIAVTLAVSWGLSRTVLRGELSVYSLELPPYRRPQVLRTVWDSLVDRTAKVLRRAVVMAAPAGVVIWLLADVSTGGTTLAAHLVHGLDPVGLAVGLNGVVLAAYLVAIPANEIVMPAILLLTLAAQGGAGLALGDLPDDQAHGLLVGVGGWTLLTAVNLMLFSLLHNPCSTTILTIWHETRSVRWTALATLLPVGLGLLVTTAVAGVAGLVTT